MIQWKTVPMKKWPRAFTKNRTNDRFGVRQGGVDWNGTLRLLERELDHLGARDIVLQMAYDPIRDLKKNGDISARAVPAHPGVIITFESTKLKKTLNYPCDQFFDWKANVRAIALALEALRLVDRYGVTSTGEQYSGFAQLPPAGGSTVTMDAREAAALLIREAESVMDVGALLASRGVLHSVWRDAAKASHPDNGGSVSRFHLVGDALRVLEAHHGNGGSR